MNPKGTVTWNNVDDLVDEMKHRKCQVEEAQQTITELEKELAAWRLKTK